MNIDYMIKNAYAINDLNAAAYLENILEAAKEYNISINKLVEYLLSTEKQKYKKNILNCLKRFYPQEKQNKIIQMPTVKLHKITIIKNEKTIGTSLEEIINNNKPSKSKTDK